jgi:hypothetical protein
MENGERFRKYTVLVADDDLNILEIHSMESRADAIDRESDLRLGQLANREYRWIKVGPTEELEDEI